MNVPGLVPAEGLAAAQRVDDDEGKEKRVSTEAGVARSEDRPLALLDDLGETRAVVLERLVIYAVGVGEEGAATRLGVGVRSGGSVAALEHLELWRVVDDASVLERLGLEDTVVVERHALASGG